MKPSYNPHRKTRKTTHGFRKRMRSQDGRNILATRRKKGRKKLTVSSEGRGRYK